MCTYKPCFLIVGHIYKIISVTIFCWLYIETFYTDIRCDNLSTPTNGNASCSSGRVGVGYEGDTCNFICNTGYELTASDTRTCQNDGSWSGTDIVCRRGKFYLHMVYQSLIEN